MDLMLTKSIAAGTLVTPPIAMSPNETSAVQVQKSSSHPYWKLRHHCSTRPTDNQSFKGGYLSSSDMPSFTHIGPGETYKMQHGILYPCSARSWCRNLGGASCLNRQESFCFKTVCLFHQDPVVLSTSTLKLFAFTAEVMPFEVTEVFELLRRLEEVQTRTAQGSGPEYLSALMCQTQKGGEPEALRQLESVRLALARYFARCSVLAVGGKGRILPQPL